jgi:hypothetical protein
VLRRFLFETRAGELFLAWLERRAGLAVVLADGLADEPSGRLAQPDCEAFWKEEALAKG